MYKGVFKIYVHGGQIFFGPVVRGTRKNLTVSEGDKSGFFFCITQSKEFPQKRLKTLFCMF